MEAYYSTVNKVVEQTGSELILFFVLVFVSLIPLYVMVIKDRKAKHSFEVERQRNYMERERSIIDVVTKNSEVISDLRATLANDSKIMAEALARNYDGLSRIHERIDLQNKIITEQGNVLTRACFAIENTLIPSLEKVKNDVSTTMAMVAPLSLKNTVKGGLMD